MNKDIYIIENDINNKVYVGQTNNVTLRWQQHKSAAKTNTGRAYIDTIMHDFGVEHFSMRILESDVADANAREQYWIQYYNCFYPDGYNKTVGGKSGYGGCGWTPAKLNRKQLNSIIADIQNTKIPFEELGRRYGISATVVTAINWGDSYFDKKLSYPLREKLYSKKKFERLTYSLQYELDKTMAQIANENDVDLSRLNEINQGTAHWVPWLHYPLRSGKVTNSACRHIKEIIALLKDPSIPQKEIAKKFSLSASTISSINYGLSYKQKGENYPIRTNYQGNPNKLMLSQDEIAFLEDLLQNSTMSMRNIAKRFECTVESIMSFNNGAIKKYRDPNKKYPLRKKFQHPVSTICG